MALHTGEIAPGAEPRAPPLLQEELLLAAHPGQILLTEMTARLVRSPLPPELALIDRGPKTRSRYRRCLLALPKRSLLLPQPDTSPLMVDS
jgi:hypothetical protein